MRIPFAIPLLLLLPAAAQHQPFITHDTRPVILHGPYLLAPDESSVTVAWITDTPSHSKVVYGASGKLDREAEPQQHGLVPVTTKHAVVISGLEPGRTYQYKAVSTRVVRMKSYWPEKGLSVESPPASFSTFDRRKDQVAFLAMTDSHADLARIDSVLKLADWSGADFLVHLGDAFDAENEDIIWSRWLQPLTAALGRSRPLLYTRGNHETRGAAARSLMDYVPVPEGRFYYARTHGPAHFLLPDTGEDKPDDTNVYAGLNRFGRYREEEYAWLENHVRTETACARAPFRVLLMHAPDFGWTAGQEAKWIGLANRAGVDLAISGHRHRYSLTRPGEGGRDYHQLVIAPNQLARVTIRAAEITVDVATAGTAGRQAFSIPARGGRR